MELIAAGSVAVKGHMGYLAAQGNGENMDGDVFNSKRKIQILIQRFHASFPFPSGGISFPVPSVSGAEMIRQERLEKICEKATYFLNPVAVFS